MITKYNTATNLAELAPTKQKLVLSKQEQTYSDMLTHDVLDIYDKKSRYLNAIKCNGNKASGEFSILNPIYYANKEIAGEQRSAPLSAIEFMLSFHQIALTHAAYLFSGSLIKNCIAMSYEDFLKNKLLLFTVGLDHMNIRKKVNPLHYYGEHELIGSRIIKNTVFLKTKFSINEGCHEGIFKSVFDLNSFSPTKK